ncbi:hypothetical protein B9Z55_015795 [Caenorhabditis nigoni]|uniref:ShKT domain-containing protein n=1 Tax=Caenorhabditis nigoni TaxID=1611254 RepID=A0A2G5UBT0_9PELO|nr:hypothetical protein B9Z55_015795 [Caenorhabditis nigoni]
MLKFIILTVFFVDFLKAEQCMDGLFTCPDMADLCSEQNIKSECPLTCGLCTPDPNICADRNPDCPTFSFMCNKYQKQCPKTCGVCKGNTTVTPTVPPRTTVFPTTVSQKTTVIPTTLRRTTVPSRTTVPLVTVPAKTTEAKTTVPPKTTVPLKTTVRATVPPPTTKTTKKPTPTTPKPPCKDSSPNCPTWAKNGFCTNTFYPPETRKEYCAKTCKYC